MKQPIDSLDSILGPSQTRYFSFGFSRFQFQVSNFSPDCQNRIRGSFCVHYDGPQRPNQQALHLGSMEYVAMGLFLAEGILIKQKRLTRHEINRSILRNLTLQIKKSVDITSGMTVPFEISIAESHQDLNTVNIGLTSLELKVQDAQMRIVIDHPGPTQIDFRDFDIWPFGDGSLHREVYRQRNLELDQIHMDLQAESISAQLSGPLPYASDVWGFSAYDNPLSPLDCVRISGQLMQVLLYSLLSRSRIDCPNIWLRCMEIDFKRPYRSDCYRVDLQFKNRQQTLLRGKPWQTVSLMSQMGNMDAKFKICHEMP
jgi:hypothetical protein